MASKTITYVVPIDFTPTTENALKFTVDMVKGHDSRIVLLHIISDYRNRTESVIELEKLKSKYNQEKISMEVRGVTGKVLTDISLIAESVGAQLIVMGTHHVSLFGKIFGSTALDVVKKSQVPLLLLQEGSTYNEIDNIAVAVDLSKESVQVVKSAAEFGKLLNAKVTLVGQRHEDPIFMTKIDINLKIAKDYLANHGIDTEIVLLSEVHFVENLINYAKEHKIDMIAATYYEETFHIFSSKLIDSLSHNALQIPVLTFDGEDTYSGTSFGFITQ